MTMETISGATDRFSRVRETTARVATILVLVVMIGLLVSTFVGHAKGPYGVCYGESGRSIPCELATKTSAK